MTFLVRRPYIPIPSKIKVERHGSRQVTGIANCFSYWSPRSYCMKMQDQPVPSAVFPLSRYFHFANFWHYYAFGNSPAEDFLQSVSVSECCRPTILSLGCGDLRSCMFTILNNFGFEGDYCNGFKGVKFVLNDRSAAVLARNILFLHLCMIMPKDEIGKKEWIASVWSLWYNHELLPPHNAMLRSALDQLIEWSGTWQDWSVCPLGKVVRYSSPAAFASVKKMWDLWYSHSFVKPVSNMKVARSDFQTHHLKKRFGQSREDGLETITLNDLRLSLLKSSSILFPQETVTKMQAEYLAYLTEGTVWAEDVLNTPRLTSHTVVNPTLFEREDGEYTLHYTQVPSVQVFSTPLTNSPKLLGN